MRDLFIKISLILFVLPVLFYSEIVNAEEIPNLNLITNAITDSSCHSLIIYKRKSDSKIAYYCNNYNGAIVTLDTNLVDGSRYIDLKTNFYGISKINACRQNLSQCNYRFRSGGYYDSINNVWVEECNTSSTYCSNQLTDFSYIMAVLEMSTTNNDSSVPVGIYYQTVDSPMYYKNYNLSYYLSAKDYFASYTGNFLQPTQVYGSSISLAGNDLSYSILGFEDSYYNSYMYSSSDIDNEVTSLSSTFNYDLPDINGNFELSFILTYKHYTDIPLIVYAQTNVNTYRCVAESKSTLHDLTYQYYVNCESVSFDNSNNDDFLNIIVNGTNEFYNLVGPVAWYDTNYLYNKSDNNKFLGISSILRKFTNVTPIPVTPPGSETETIDDIYNYLTDSSSPNFSSLSNSAGWLPAGPVDSIINLPLTLFTNVLTSLDSNLCSPVVLPLPFLNNSVITLPCIDSLITSMGFGTFWQVYVGSLVSGIILYNYLINLYRWIDRTLTFRENNFSDWGGI